MTTSYLIPAQPLSVDIEVRKSRFVCHLSQAENAEQAKQFITDIRQQYPEATHNCWAFQTEQPGSTRSIGCSDDGEPHGTAGKPMFNVLCHADVGELVAVVSRYYGGTKLGTGGLARAYSDSVIAALDKLQCCEKVDWQYATLIFDYSLQSSVENIFQETEVEIMASNFAEEVSFDIRFNLESLEQINTRLNNISQGKLSIKAS